MGKYNFKVGDKLKVIKGSTIFDKGDIVTCNTNVNTDYDEEMIEILKNGTVLTKWHIERFELVEDDDQSSAREFQVGDRVIGIKHDILGCEGIIEVIGNKKILIRFTKLGNQNWHDGTQSDWKIGGLSRFSKWLGCLELIKEVEEKTPSKNVKMKTKKIYNVLIVDKKTGKATKDEKVVAGDEQQAILKTFGVDAENTFIKITELGEYEEEKPVQAILVKQEVAKEVVKANPKTTSKK